MPRASRRVVLPDLHGRTAELAAGLMTAAGALSNESD